MNPKVLDQGQTRQATPPPAFLFHSQCQTSADKRAFTRPSAASVTRLENRPRLRRGGDIDPDLFPVNRLFSPNPQAIPPAIFGRKRLTSGPIGWIRKAMAAVGRKGPYTPRTLSLQHQFSRKCMKKEFSAAHIHRGRECARKALKSLCFLAFCGVRQGWM